MRLPNAYYIRACFLSVGYAFYWLTRLNSIDCINALVRASTQVGRLVAGYTQLDIYSYQRRQPNIRQVNDREYTTLYQTLFNTSYVKENSTSYDTFSRDIRYVLVFYCSIYAFEFLNIPISNMWWIIWNFTFIYEPFI